jgi:hypothetical protein
MMMMARDERHHKHLYMLLYGLSVCVCVCIHAHLHTCVTCFKAAKYSSSSTPPPSPHRPHFYPPALVAHFSVL